MNILPENNNNINIKLFILDPLSVIIKLAIISNKPIGTKISIYKKWDNVMFNTFVKYCPLVFLSPQSCISEFKVQFLLPDGSRPNFRGMDHSFTLKITEIITQCYNTGLNSKNSNYTETISKLSMNH